MQTGCKDDGVYCDSISTSLASTGSWNRFHIWSCLLCTHVPTFQQFVHVLQALCCSPLMHSTRLTPLSDSTSRLSPEHDSEAERLHPARQLRVVGFVPCRRRRLGYPAICLEELEVALSQGTSGLWVDRRGPYQEWHPCSAVDKAERGNNW